MVTNNQLLLIFSCVVRPQTMNLYGGKKKKEEEAGNMR